jgi:hypothetical protein
MLLASLGKQLLSKDRANHLSAPVERPKSLSEIEGSNAMLLAAIDPNNKTIPATWSPIYIDVRDIATAHYKAAIAPAAAGKSRYLIAGPGVGLNKDVPFTPIARLTVEDSRVSRQTPP